MKKLILWLVFVVALSAVYYGGYLYGHRTGYVQGMNDAWNDVPIPDWYEVRMQKSPGPNDGESPGDAGG